MVGTDSMMRYESIARQQDPEINVTEIYGVKNYNA